MPLVSREDHPDVASRRRKRLCIVGPPNSRKTSSIKTAYGPVAVISCPGENGAAAIPVATVTGEPVKAWIWDEPDLTNPATAAATWAELRRVTAEIIAGKHGEFRTLVLDGAHKIYQTLGKIAKQEFVTKSGMYDGRQGWPWQHDEFFTYLQSTIVSPIEYMWITCWDQLEKDDPFAKDSSDAPAPRHIQPDLPGKACNLVKGEMSLVYASQTGAGKTAEYFWLTQPLGMIWASGLKLPEPVATKIPLRVPQDWRALEAMFQ